MMTLQGAWVREDLRCPWRPGPWHGPGANERIWVIYVNYTLRRTAWYRHDDEESWAPADEESWVLHELESWALAQEEVCASISARAGVGRRSSSSWSDECWNLAKSCSDECRKLAQEAQSRNNFGASGPRHPSQREVFETPRGEPQDKRPGLILRLVFPDECCGRLIGRDGSVLNRLRKELDCNIFIANKDDFIRDIKRFKARTVDVRGAQGGSFQDMRNILQKVLHAAAVPVHLGFFILVESQEHGLRGADGATWGLADLALGPGAADLRLDADNIDTPRNPIVRTSLRYRAILCKGDDLPVLNAVMDVAKFSGAGTPTTHVVVPMPTVSRPIRQRNPNHSNIIDPSLSSHVNKRKHQQKKKLASDKGRMSAKNKALKAHHCQGKKLRAKFGARKQSHPHPSVNFKNKNKNKKKKK